MSKLKEMGLTSLVAFALSIAVMTLIISCKARGPSGLRSLDQFTELTRRHNYCVADPKVTYDPKNFPILGRIHLLGDSGVELDTPLRNLVSHAVINIPIAVQQAFVAAAGQVLIMDNASEICRDVAKVINPGVAGASDLDEMQSCLVVIPATKTSGELLHAVFPSQIKAVHHHMMRVFGSFVTDVMPVKLPRTKTAVYGAMDLAARDLVADITLSKVLSARTLKNFFTDADFDQLKNRIFKDPNIGAVELFSGLEAAKNSDLWRFKKMAFIESFDSYFCNGWADERQSLVRDVVAQRKSGRALDEVQNTRYMMSQLFPKTFRGFSVTFPQVIDAVSAPGGHHLSLAPTRSDDQSSGSPAWAGTKAFFGSLWSNTGGAVARVQQRYAARVEQEIYKAVDSGSSLAAALAVGTVSGAASSYHEEIAEPVGQRADRVFQEQITGGASIDQALRNTLTVELLRPTGAPAIAETTYLGQRFDGSAYKDNVERATEFVGGVSSLAGTTAAVVAFVPGVGNRVVGGGSLPESPGVLPSAAEAAENAAKAKSLGVPLNRIQDVGEAFESGAHVTVIPKGTTLYRAGGSAGKWMTLEPIKDPVNSLALPVSSESGAHALSKFITTKDITVLQGKVAPQPSMVTPGNLKLGGVVQIYIPKEQLLSGVRVAADQAILGGAAGAGAATRQK